MHVTAVKVEYKTPTNRINKGVATSWLATKVPNEENPPQVPIFIRKSQFRYVRYLLSANWCVSSAVSEASSELYGLFMNSTESIQLYKITCNKIYTVLERIGNQYGSSEKILYFS